jgi:hypothetical protein
MKNIMNDLRNGIERVSWFSKLFAERLNIEIAIFRLLHESDRTARTRDELLKRIGERVTDMKDHHDRNVLRDPIVAEAMAEINRLETRIEELKSRVAEIGKVTD